MSFELSEYQKKIKSYFVEYPRNNMAIEALAGSGKTSTALMLTELTKTSDVYVAFNKSIQLEMKAKLNNPKTKCYTMHGLAFSVMNYNLGKDNIQATLDNFKLHKIIDEIFEDEYRGDMKKINNTDYRNYLKDNYVSLYNIIRLKNIETLSSETIEWFCEEFGIFNSTSEFIAHTSNEILNWIEKIDNISINLFEVHHLIDFTDMLYITYKKIKDEKWDIPYWMLFTNIYYDEFQDASALHQKLIRYFKRKNGRFILIYDKNQAIYGFAGADCKATDNIDKMFGPIEHFRLPINYRCGTKILSYVNRQFKVGILPKPNAIEGQVIRISDDQLKDKIAPNDFIIGRKNQQLISTALSLVRSGIKIYLSDKEVIDKVLKTVQNTKQKTVGKILNYCDNAIKKYEKLTESQKKKFDKEDIDLIKILINYFCCNNQLGTACSANVFIEYIRSVINTDNPDGCVRIMSIHKSKGLEADSVFVLNEGRVFTELGRSGDMIQQEKNLSYVALTRAKINLYLVRSAQEDDEYEF